MRHTHRKRSKIMRTVMGMRKRSPRQSCLVVSNTVTELARGAGRDTYTDKGDAVDDKGVLGH